MPASLFFRQSALHGRLVSASCGDQAGKARDERQQSRRAALENQTSYVPIDQPPPACIRLARVEE
jgi:hypothetical protein